MHASVAFNITPPRKNSYMKPSHVYIKVVILSLFYSTCVHFIFTYSQWRSQSSAITRAVGGRGHVCYYKMNFDPSLEYLGVIFAAEVDRRRS